MPFYDFDPPQRFVAGTVGPPGQRVFFLQARDLRRLVSVSCEKEQLVLLSDRLLDLLDERAGAAGAEAAAAAYADDAPLDTPIEDEFRVSTLSLAWDPDRPSVVIEATPEEDGAEEQGPEREGVTPTEGLRVTMSPAQARAFARRAQALISAGRPPCPFCGGPLDPQGHVCPRANGYRR
jgi:uncharacterized repeat protein (TIGR03847 family)